jgi:hypothetical protein
MNAYTNKYASKYTYICIFDSLIIGKFGGAKSDVIRGFLLIQ